MEIFALVAPAKQMFFKGTMLCSGIFKQGQYYTLKKIIFFYTIRQGRYSAVAATFFDTSSIQTLQCDTIPPPVALQPLG